MRNYNDFLNEILLDDEELKREIEITELKYTLIDVLLNYRKNHNLTQSEFASRINVKQQMISRFEQGEVDPRLSFISKLLIGMNKNIIFEDKDYISVNTGIEFKDKKKINAFPKEYVIKDFNIAV